MDMRGTLSTAEVPADQTHSSNQVFGQIGKINEMTGEILWVFAT